MKQSILNFVRRVIGQPQVIQNIRTLEQELGQLKDMLEGMNNGDRKYDDWSVRTFANAPPAPRCTLCTSWNAEDNKYGVIVNNAMMEAETVFVEDQLRYIRDQRVPGVIVEFGVFDGSWLEKIIAACEALEMARPIYGFDSFEGLPTISPEHDLDCWFTGQYAADFDHVYEKLRCRERGHVKLIKGWFSDTLKHSDIDDIREVAFARVDCDLYQPTVECLAYLQPRLSDGAVLVFDDWTWNLDKGETKAFQEWQPGSGLDFEFLAYNSMGHLYLKAHRKSSSV